MKYAEWLVEVPSEITKPLKPSFLFLLSSHNMLSKPSLPPIYSS